MHDYIHSRDGTHTCYENDGDKIFIKALVGEGLQYEIVNYMLHSTAKKTQRLQFFIDDCAASSRVIFPDAEEISTRSNFHFIFEFVDIFARPYETWAGLLLRFRNLNLTSKSTLVLKRILTKILTI